MKSSRASGVLLHVSSLPGRFAVGDLGPAAREFVDFLADSGQKYWQTLPLGPTGYGNSPYQSLSAIAGNPLFISPELLARDGLLKPSDWSRWPALASGPADYDRAAEIKHALLRNAFTRLRQAPSDLRKELAEFCAREAGWLDDFTLYMAAKKQHGDGPWTKWPAALRDGKPEALAGARRDLAPEIAFEQFRQWLFFRQWAELREHARSRGVQLIGDIPIFVAHDSVDVWRRPDLYQLEADGSLTVQAGVPGDYFNADGQLWGNPIYRWDRMAAEGFAWWIERLRELLRLVDVVRIDHFRGFAAYWEVPGDAPNARVGRWVDAPGHELFQALRQALGDFPIIAEDLGLQTPEVAGLRDAFGFPGMRVLQFGFGGDRQSPDLPHNYPEHCVAYSGTHDNSTARGWFDEQPGANSTRTAEQIAREQAFCLDYLKCNAADIPAAFVEATLESPAALALVPLQDVLGLGDEARMNLPGSATGTWWRWRCPPGALTPELAARLHAATRAAQR